jgi:hypothetical protein
MKRALLILLLVAMPLAAQQRTNTNANTNTAATRESAEEPDVVVDVPRLHVESIVLDVQDLKAHVSLDARVGNLVTLNAGANAGIEKVRLEINGVDAEVYLVVRLDKVREIIERTLETVDKNPQMVTRLLDTVDNTVGTVGKTLENVTAPGGVLSQTVNSLGQTVTRTLDQAGNIVERTTDAAGKVVGERVIKKEQ